MRHFLIKKIRKFIFLLGIIMMTVTTVFFGYRVYLRHERENDEELELNTFMEKFNDQVINYQQNEYSDSEYVAVLKIPKIELEHGIYNKDSSYNSLDNGLYLLGVSVFPNENNNSQVILASHSGTSDISYFKRLGELELGDVIYLYYEQVMYTYKIEKIYEVSKDGTVEIGVYNTSNINLITCSGDNMQLVVVGMMV